MANVAALPSASIWEGALVGTDDAGLVFAKGGRWVMSTPDVLHVRTYGAIGDGLSHPLSQRYATLALAQADYPSAVSLAEEIDFNALRVAIEIAITLGGGTVYVPHGRFMMNNATVPKAFLRLPECNRSGTGQQVDIVGAGHAMATLKWATDFGSLGSNFAICCGDPSGTRANGLGRFGSGAQYEGQISNIALEGPKIASSKGVVNAHLSGMGWGARRYLNRVLIRGFYAGIDLVGDWTQIDQVWCLNNFYGLYSRQRSTHMYGNVQFNKCSFSASALANIAIGPDNGYIRAMFFNCFLGTAPYAIMGEAGAGAGGKLISRFQDCQFEWLGNALICDENGLNGGTKSLEVQRSTFTTCYIDFNDDDELTTNGRGFTAMVSAHTLSEVRLEQMEGIVSGSLAVFDVTVTEGLIVEGDLDFIYTLTTEFLRGSNYAGIFLTHTIGGWKGKIVNMESDCARFDLIEYDAVSASHGTLGTAGTNPCAGVAQHAATAGMDVVVANAGRIVVKGSGTIADGAWLKKAGNGAVEIAAGPDDGPIAGWATGTSSGRFVLSPKIAA